MLKAPVSFFSTAAVVAAAMLWGTTGTIQGILPSGRDPLVVATMRVVLASVALALFLAAVLKRDLSPGSVSRGAEGTWPGLIVAGLAIAAYNVTFFAGVSLAGVAVGTAIALGSGPIWVAAITFVIEGTLPTRGLIAGQICAISGLFVIAYAGDPVSVSWGGLLLSLLAGLAYAIYSIVTYRLSHRGNAANITFLTFTIAAIVMLPVLFLRNTSWLTVDAFPPLIFLGCVSTAIAFVLFSYGIRYIQPTNAVSLALAEPLTAWMLATFVLHEHMTVAKISGAVILFLGLLIMGRGLTVSLRHPERPDNVRFS